MITKVPTSTDFLQLGGECLNQAFEMIFDIDQDRQLIRDQDVSLKEVWQYYQGTLRTAIVLVHQGIEAFMKAAVCNVTPLLLINNQRDQWPTMPVSKDVEFANLYSIGAEDLLHTYASILSTKLSTELITLVDEVRKKRNVIVHGLSGEQLTPATVVEMVLKSFTLFIGKDAWWSTMRRQFISDPLFGMMDSEFEIASFSDRLDYVESILGKGKFQRHFSQNLKARRYFCPECKYQIQSQLAEMESKWAFLRPNEPSSTTIFCLNCQKTFPVTRTPCTVEYCDGNVFSEEFTNSPICLTCGEEYGSE